MISLLLHFPLKTTSGLVVSLFTAGAFCGAFVAGYLGDMVRISLSSNAYSNIPRSAEEPPSLAHPQCLSSAEHCKLVVRYAFLPPLARLSNAAVECRVSTSWPVRSWNRRRNVMYDRAIVPGRTRTPDDSWSHHGVAAVHVGCWSVPPACWAFQLILTASRRIMCILDRLRLVCTSLLCPSRTNAYSYVGFSSHDDRQWRVPLGLQCIPAGILGLLIFLFPESPRWLIDNDRVPEGLQVLANLHAHGDKEDLWVRVEFSQIQESLAFEHDHAAKTWGELFKNKANFRRVFLCVALQGSIQMTGVSASMFPF